MHMPSQHCLIQSICALEFSCENSDDVIETIVKVQPIYFYCTVGFFINFARKFHAAKECEFSQKHLTHGLHGLLWTWVLVILLPLHTLISRYKLKLPEPALTAIYHRSRAEWFNKCCP
eukprot:m.115661 g.115661  ORF g.115661 m.115661 type:complete len:118 (+) comp17152_c0_seq2:1119-1472(+)